jgi:multimeric flavodoxin WrbA
MKVIAFNGSARKDGNTAILIKQVFGELEKEGIETELIQLAGTQVSGCIACSECFETLNQRCVVTNDSVNDYIAKMLEADGIILGSPTYFADLTPELKALIDRAGMVASANGDMFQRKVGAPFTPSTRSITSSSLVR